MRRTLDFRLCFGLRQLSAQSGANGTADRIDTANRHYQDVSYSSIT
jgi:hypothetical protein